MTDAARKPRRSFVSVPTWILIFVLSFVWFLPAELRIPVEDAAIDDWNENSFWFEPWGVSGVHKGIDIFARRGTPVLAAASGVVILSSELELGGRVAIIIGPKWRLHYYAHLDSVDVRTGERVARGDKIGRVGNSGNAAGKTPHLHFAIGSLVPLPTRYNKGSQGWKRMFYLNPHEELLKYGTTID